MYRPINMDFIEITRRIFKTTDSNFDLTIALDFADADKLIENSVVGYCRHYTDSQHLGNLSFYLCPFHLGSISTLQCI